MDFIDVILIFALGVGVGWWWHAHRMFVMLSQNPTPMIDILTRVQRRQQDHEDDQVELIECSVEWIGDQCYVWDKSTGDFLGQGSDLESAITQSRRLRANTEYHIAADLAKKPK